MAISTLGIALGVGLTGVAVWMHLSRGAGWEPSRDLSGEIMERRAATVPETDFPTPMSRAVGGGGVAAIPAGEAGELEEGEAAEAEEDLGPGAIPDDEAGSFEIDYEKEGATVEVAENETLLAAGEDEGWDLPYACREGQCLSCGAHIPDGPADDFVVHHTQEMLNEEELEEGFVLTCVAYPTADFTLETRETP